MTALKLPYHYAGSTTGCLLIHGFISTPAELRIIAEALIDAGYTTKGILLPGHGTRPSDLLNVTCKDWIESAQQGINELKKTCHRVVIIGHSMGGLLALQMAARNKIDTVITISAALKPTNHRTKLAWLLKYFIKYASSSRKQRPPEQEKYLIHYPYFPVAAVAELQRLANHTKKILPYIKADTLVIQTKDDKVIKPECAEIIINKISSVRKECLLLEKGTHNAPIVPPFNEQIITKIIDFIKDKNQPTSSRKLTTN